MKRTRSLSLLVVVAVVALVLGSLGTAVAGPVMTKAKVRAIATKVVKKAAPGLSVAYATNAANATNATNLNGQPASAYQTKVYRYALPVQPAAGSHNYTFPGLPAGNYLASYTVVLSTTASNTTSVCFMRQTAGGQGIALGYASFNGSFSAISASGVVSAVPTLTMNCNAATNFTIMGGTGTDSSVTFMSIDSLSEGTTAATRGTVDMGPATVAK